MRKLFLVVLGIYLGGCTPTTCSTQHPTQAAAKPNPAIATNPLYVTLYESPNSTLKPGFKVIGKQSVSKYNEAGNRRQKALIFDAMRKQAALMGGDAVIDIRTQGNDMVGTVITFKPQSV